jgi:hypothetical protein
VDEVVKSAEVDERPAGNGLVGIQVVAFKDLTGVVQGMENRALPGTIGAKKQRQRLEVQIKPLADTFEVLDGDAAYHYVLPI